MSLDISSVGATSEPFEHVYEWRDQALYALGIGAKHAELNHLYEGSEGGLQTFPSYAVVPAFAPVFSLLASIDVSLESVVHGGQKVRSVRPLPPNGRLSTVGKLEAIYDLKRFATVVASTTTSMNGEIYATTEWSIIVRDAGRFGGPRPVKDLDVLKPPRGVEPDFVCEAETSPEQALLYRLSGDTNPLHADPAFAASVGFERGPILHGLCTYGFMTRAVMAHAQTGGGPKKLRGIGAQFRSPVWPGDTILTSGWQIEPGKFALQAKVVGRDDLVVSNAWATFD